MKEHNHGASFHAGGRDSSCCAEEEAEANEEDLLAQILSEIIKYAGEDELAKIDTEHLSAFMSAVLVEVVKMMEARDKQQLSQFLDDQERQELEELRRIVTEQATDLGIKARNIEDLVVQLRDAQHMRNAAEKALNEIRALLK